MALEKSAIVAAALALLDSAGLEGLTMRRLADVLGVKAASLYWHYPSKQALLADMAEAILAPVAASPIPAQSYRITLRTVATELRHALLTRRDSALLLSGLLHTQDEGLRLAELVIGALTRAGFAADLAARVSFVLLSYVQGYVIDEQALGLGTAHQVSDVLQSLPIATAARYPAATAALASMVDEGPDIRFATGIDLLLAGLSRESSHDDTIDRMVEAFRSTR